jgi:hypothetical protein
MSSLPRVDLDKINSDQGKPGQSLTKLMDGLASIDHKKVQTETQTVSALAEELWQAV